jgi:ABC-type polysaccharide/polyol phosphate export permease
MFQPTIRKTPISSAFSMLELIFHASVREIRKSHGNAVVGLLISILQSLLMVLIFYTMLTLLGGRRMQIRGDFLLYVMSGVFMFMTHTKTLQAVQSADGPTAAMMKHAPMNTIVSISSAALSTLYQQVLSAGVILFFYNTMFARITIDDPIGTSAMFLLSWLSGIAVGMVFKAVTPWQPEFFGIATLIYARINMIASGKLFVANTMPTSKLVFFDWNPLFHTIDQGRGFIFLNYSPHYTSISYPLIVTAILMVLGLMGEHYTRKHASASWGAGR